MLECELPLQLWHCITAWKILGYCVEGQEDNAEVSGKICTVQALENV